MVSLRVRSPRKRFFATVFAVLGCLFLATGGVAVTDAVYSYAGNAGYVQRESEAVIRPLKTYTDISVTVPDGLAVYKDVTTGLDLKKNLRVIGTYDGGFARLQTSEFTVSINGKVLDDNSPVPVLNEDGTASGAISLDLECSLLTYHIDQLLVVESLPVYDSLTVTGPTQIGADADEESVKDLISVTGVAGEESFPVGNKELYSASFSQSLAAGRTVTVNVTLGEASGKLENVKVVAAKIQGIFVAADPALTVLDGYYRDPADKVFPDKEDSAYYGTFVKGMYGTDVQSRIMVYAVLENSRVLLGSAGSSGYIPELNTNYTGEIENVQYNDNNNSISVKITVGTEVYNDRVTLPFEDRKAVKLDAVYKGDALNLTSATMLNSGAHGDFDVTVTYNDRDTEVITDYVIDGSLYPSKNQFPLSENDIYSKTVTVCDKDRSISAEVGFENIVYKPYAGVTGVYGTAVTQVANQPFDFTGLYATAEFSVDVPGQDDPEIIENQIDLADYADDCTVTFYAGTKRLTSGVGRVNVPSRSTNVNRVTVSYGGKENRFDISVVPAPHVVPVVDERSVNYSEGGTIKPVTGIDWENDLKTGLTVTVTDRLTGESAVIATYSYAAGNVSLDSSECDFAKYENGAVVFLRGSEFTVTFALTDGAAGDYGWYTADNRVEYSKSYRIRVNKGLLDVRMAERTVNIIYGEEPSLAVKCYPLGSSVALDSSVAPTPTFKYYGFTDESGKTYTYGDPSLVRPTVVGTYYVIATTEDTDGYRSSTTFDSNRATLTIAPRPVKTGAVAPPRAYSRTTWTPEELIDIDRSAFLAEDIEGDKADAIISVEQSGVNSEKAIRHAGDYGIKLTLNNKNYVWTSDNENDIISVEDGKSVISTVFTVTPYTVPDFTMAVKLSDTEFIYGEGNLTVDFAYPDGFYPLAGGPVFQIRNESGTWEDYSDHTLAEFAEWQAGTYRVGYTTELNSEHDEDGDYTVGDTAYREFTVMKKVISSLGLSAERASYNGKSNVFSIAGYDGGFMSYSAEGATQSVADDGNGTISVLHADTYTVKVSFTDNNHAWSGALDSDGDGEVTLTYILDPVTLTVVWTSGNASAPALLEYPFSEGMARVKPVAGANGTADGDAVSLKTEVYSEYDGRSDITEADKFNAFVHADGANAAGTYYVYVTGITVAGNGVASDYVLPALYHASYRIGKAKLELPAVAASTPQMSADGVVRSGQVFTAVYRGSVFTIEKYLFNYEGHVTYTVNGDSSLQVLYADSYTIEITPGANYVWDDGSENGSVLPQTVTFIVSAKPIDLDWSALAHTYDDSDKSPAVAARPSDVCGDDALTVSFCIDKNENYVSDSGVTFVRKAGVYRVHAVALMENGDVSRNYTIKSETRSTDFTINKAVVSRPELTVSAVTFGDGKTIEFTASTDWAVLAARAGGVAEVSGRNNLGNEVAAGAAFTFTSSGFTFEYTDAGLYKLTFTLNDFENYRWADGNAGGGYVEGTETCEIGITVNRKTLKLGDPSWTKEQWSDWRISEWEAGMNERKTLSVNGLPELTVSYGSVTVSGGSVSYTAIPDDEAISERGRYYVRYAVKAGDTPDKNPLNYIWAEADGAYLYVSNTNQILVSGSASAQNYKTDYGEDGVYITIHYAVTNRVLGLTYEFAPYTFGDTVKASGAISLNDVFTIKDETEGSKDTLIAEWDKGHVTLTLTFTDKADNSVSVFTYDSGMKSGSDSGDLVNHLPWNKGEYDVTVEWTFSDESDFETAAIHKDLTVNALDIRDASVTVEWGAEEGVTNADGKFSFVYDGVSRGLTATVVSAPQRPGQTLLLPVLSVTHVSKVNTDAQGNVIAHKVYVETIADGEATGGLVYRADNFDIRDNGGYLLENELTVLRRTLTVSVKAPDGSKTYRHTYGDGLPDVSGWFEVEVKDGEGFAGGDSALDCLTVSLDRGGYTGSDALLPANAAGYVLTPELKDNEYSRNYVLVVPEDGEGKFVVEKRAIEVTVTAAESDREHVYGDDPADISGKKDFYAVGGKGLPDGVDAGQVFALSVNGIASDSDITTAANRYFFDITVTENGKANYDITFAESTYEYFVRPATLNVRVELTIFYGENSPVNYDGKGNMYLAGNDNLRRENGIYKIDDGDFKFDDKNKFYNTSDIAVTGGEFEYATDYTPGDIGRRDITFAPNGLAWGNYVFAGGVGSLNVVRREITVAILSQSRPYYSELAALNTENAGFTVSAAVSSYGLDGATHFFGAYSSYDRIFAIEVNSLDTEIKDGITIATGKVNSDGYAITLRSLAGDKYDIKYNTDAVYVVSAADYKLLPDTSKQTLSYDDTIRPSLKAALDADTQDGIRADVLYYLSKNSALPVGFDWDVSGSSDIPGVFRADTYYVFFRISAENHKTFVDKICVEVLPSENAFTESFDYNDKAVTVINGDRAAAFAKTEGVGGEAWIYGGYTAGMTGFVTPATRFDGFNGNTSGNKIYVSVEFYRKTVSAGTESVSYVAEYVANAGLDEETTLGDVLDTVFSRNKFGAGYYAVTYTMPASGNDYAAVSETRVFRVAKAELTVTAHDSTVVYGEEHIFTADAEHHSNHAADISGYKYGETDTTVFDGRNTSVKKNFEFVTNKVASSDPYKAGNDAGSAHRITIDDDNGYASDNYEFVFIDGKLTVEKRSVTLVIDKNKKDGTSFNHYDLYDKGTIESYDTPTLDIADGSLYGYFNGQTPVVLHTKATFSSEGKRTADKGVYAVYAVWSDDSHAVNYAVAFENCSWAAELGDDDVLAADIGKYIGGGATYSAGTYVIESAPVVVTYNVPKSPVYDGKPKEITIATSNLTGLTFNATYRKVAEPDGTAADTELDGKPVDAGTYEATFTYAGTSENYTVSEGAAQFSISRATLGITVSGVTIRYGTALPASREAATAELLFNDGKGYVISYRVPDTTYPDIAGSDAYDGYKTISETYLLNAEGDKISLDYAFASRDYNVKTSAGTVCTVTASGVRALNFTVPTISFNLTVRQRAVIVTVHGSNGTNAGAKTIYAGDYMAHQNALTADVIARFNAYFTLPDGWNGSSGDASSVLGLSLTLPGNAVDVTAGGYVMTPRYAQNGSNYDVSFDYGALAFASFEIEQATLTVKAEVKPGVRYGDAVSVTPSYSGWAGKDIGADHSGHAAYLTAQTTYVPWESGAGNYTVSYSPDAAGTAGGGLVSTLTLNNYKVVYAAPTGFTVSPRPITATRVNNPVYNGGEIDINGGKSGKTLHAQFVFADPDNVEIADAYLPKFAKTDAAAKNKYTLAYSGASSTPNIAGDYTVTVTLGGNYVFADNSMNKRVYSYNIQKQEIVIRWDNASVNWTSDSVNVDETRTIENFYSSIMGIADDSVGGFYRQWEENGHALTEPVTDAALGGSGKTYVIDTASSELRFTALVSGGYTGRYYTTVQLNSDAAKNYTLSNVNGSGASVTLVLVVTTDSVNIMLSIEGWTYKQEVNAPVYSVDGGSGGISISYARVYAYGYGDEIPSEYMQFTNVNAGSVLLELGAGAFNVAINGETDAGVYIVRALYADTNQSAYRVFKILPASVKVPTFTLTSSGAEQNDTYNGNALTLTIKVDTAVISVAMDGSATLPVPGGVQLGTVGAGNKTIRYSLVSANYVWDTSDLPDGVTAAGDAYEAVWTVNKGVAAISGLVAQRITHGETPKRSGDARFGAYIAYSYRPAVAGGDPGDHADGWTDGVVGAGTYWVKAVSSDDPLGNYTGDTAYSTVTVDPATLYVTVGGTMTYGEPEGKTLTYNYEGWVGAEINTRPEPDDYSKVGYTLKIDDTLSAGSHAIELIMKDGAVIGVSVPNYVIVSRTGTFTVNRKSIEVTVSGGGKPYSVSPFTAAADLSDIAVSVPAGIDKESLKITLGLSGAFDGQTLDAGSYSITAVSGNGNYIVTFTTGIYTVSPRLLRIGGFEGGGQYGSVAAARVIVLYDVTGGGQITVSDQNVLDMLKYSYTTQAGAALSAMPGNAGEYNVSVSLTGANSGNYTLTGRADYAFTVTKRIYSYSDIKLSDVVYDGKAHNAPTIDYGGYDDSEFTVTPGWIGDAVDVGEYTVTIRIKDAANNRWELVEGAERSFTFAVTPGTNIVNGLSVANWIYGEYDRGKNSPVVETLFPCDPSTYVFTYYRNGAVVDGIPSSAGVYTVTVTIPATANFSGATGAASFSILQKEYTAPTLGIITSGDGRNDVFTGETLKAFVNGFDASIMQILYDGVSNLNGNSLEVHAVNAGTYTVKLVLRDKTNYSWAGATTDENGDAVLTWTVARKKLDKPVHNDSLLMVNGKVLEYFPEGFDGDVMRIEGNRSGYGGTFSATVSLLDPDNYEWADGSTDPVTFKWKVVGVNTVFGIVMGSVGGAAAVASAAAAVMFVQYRKKKRLEASAGAYNDKGAEV